MTWHVCTRPDECLKLRKLITTTPGSSPLSIRKNHEQQYAALHKAPKKASDDSAV